MPKFELGQEVRVSNELFANKTQNKLAKIIGVHLQSSEYYAQEYTIVVQGVYDKQYGSPKLKKIQASESDLSAIKVIRAYCYKEDGSGELQWFSNELEEGSYGGLTRIKEMDMRRVF